MPNDYAVFQTRQIPIATLEPLFYFPDRDRTYKATPKYKQGAKVSYSNPRYHPNMKLETKAIIIQIYNYSNYNTYSIKILEGYFKNIIIEVDECFIKKIDERKIPTWL